MYKRRKNLSKAWKFISPDQIETDYQWSYAKGINRYINETAQKYYTEHPLTERHLTSEVHQHICAYQLLSNDKSWCAAQCRKECKKLPPRPNEWMDYCDICPKMTYIAFDNDLNVIYASRTFTEDILKWEQENL